LNEKLTELGQRVLTGGLIARPELLELVRLGQESPYDLLYWANRIRTSRFGSAVKLCCIVPGKLGGCREDCKWCAQSAASAPGAIPAKRTTPQDILSAARTAAGCGAACIGVVNSGRRPSPRDLEEIVAAVTRIKSDPQTRGIEICASLGELTGAQAERLAQAGIARYHHNLETSRRFFPNVVTTHTYHDRLATLDAAARAGMRLCCGGLFGLGETWEDRLDLALTLRDQVKPESVPLNFLHPIPGTALHDARPLAPMEILTIIAVFRFALPDTDLRIAGGRTVNLRDMQSWIFYAGATSTLTGKYLTTPGRAPEEDRRMIADLGLQIVTTWPASLGG
jgi:biotin synthase